MGIRLAFPATKNNSVEISYISYKNLRYTFDKFAEKIDGRALVPSSHVKACDFLGFVEYFFTETFHDNLPVAQAEQLSRSIKKTTSCKKATELPGQTSSLIGQKNIFLPNQQDGIRPLLELVR